MCVILLIVHRFHFLLLLLSLEDFMVLVKKSVYCWLRFIAVLAPLSGAISGDKTPRIDKRQDNQDRRIEQDFASGSLTPAEVKTA